MRKMNKKMVSSALKLQAVLRSCGSLDLWEARAILAESREFTIAVLHWLAAQGTIRYKDAARWCIEIG